MSIPDVAPAKTFSLYRHQAKAKLKSGGVISGETDGGVTAASSAWRGGEIIGDGEGGDIHTFWRTVSTTAYLLATVQHQTPPAARQHAQRNM
jgi:hypothetical protein